MRTLLLAVAASMLCLPPALAKDPAQGAATFTLYEGWMSPQQQPGDEADAPRALTKATGLQSTEPSVPREQRKSRGHGQLRFTKDLTRAYVDVEITGVNPADINESIRFAPGRRA